MAKATPNHLYEKKFISQNQLILFTTFTILIKLQSELQEEKRLECLMMLQIHRSDWLKTKT